MAFDNKESQSLSLCSTVTSVTCRQAGMPARAARTVTSNEDLMNNGELVQRIANALLKGEMFERAGDLYEKIRKYQEALQCYRRGEAYRRAVELAR